MPIFSLCSSCFFLLLSVSDMASFIDCVMVSAYIITLPSTFLAALPNVWIKLVIFLKNPSLSASRIATRETSGMSSPSLSKFIPTRTSNSPSLSCRISSVLWRFSISECRYRTLIWRFERYSAKSSAMRFVSVVTRTRWLLSVRFFISDTRSSIWLSVFRTSTWGSTSPVGLTSCSAIWKLRARSYWLGVADTNIAFLMYFSNSANFNGLLSNALGSLNP